MGYINEFPHSRMFDSDLREILEIFNSVMKLPNEFNSLKNYVTDYFKNLNVEEEINDKLDLMLADGTLQGIIEKILADIVFVENWGAVGDGVTDDTEALKNAFANAEGKVVVFKSNTYLVDATFNITETRWWETYNVGINLPSNAHIIGNGATLKMKPNSATGYFIINGRQVKNTIIDNLNFLGDINEHLYVDGSTSEWGCGLALFGCQNIEVRNCRFTNIMGDGIYIGQEHFYQANKTVNSHNVHILNCVIDRAGRNGISVCDGVGHTIENCEINNITRVEPRCAIDLETEGDGQKVYVECVIRNLKSSGCFNGINNFISDKVVVENIEINLVENGYATLQSFNDTNFIVKNAILNNKVMIFGGNVKFDNVNDIDINITTQESEINFSIVNSKNIRIYKRNSDKLIANIFVDNCLLVHEALNGYLQYYNSFIVRNSHIINKDVQNVAIGAINLLEFDNCKIECNNAQYLFTGKCDKLVMKNCDIWLKSMLASLDTNLVFRDNFIKTEQNHDAIIFLYGAESINYIIDNVFNSADEKSCVYTSTGKTYIANNVIIGTGTLGGSGSVVKNNVNMERN